MKNNRVIKVTVLPATNTQPNRIVLKENRFEKTDRKTIYFTNDNTIDSVKEYLKSININIIGFGSFNNDYYFLSDSWAHTNENGFKTIKGTLENN